MPINQVNQPPNPNLGIQKKANSKPSAKKTRTAKGRFKRKKIEVDEETEIEENPAKRSITAKAKDRDIVLLNTDLLKCILSFVVSPVVKLDNEYDECGRRLSLKREAECLKSVSKAFLTCVDTLQNLQAPTKFMSAQNLAKIKRSVRLIDLSCLHAAFTNDLKNEWQWMRWGGSDDSEESSFPPPLQCVVNRFGGSFDGFAQLVAEEYKLFLVVKCVEVLAAKQASQSPENSSEIAVWNEKCSPTKSIIGELIDHEAGYVSQASQKGSDFDSKKKLLFSFERSFHSEQDAWYQYFGNRISESPDSLLFSPEFSFAHVADVLYQDMRGYNDCG